jgi:hypothetical protein
MMEKDEEIAMKPASDAEEHDTQAPHIEFLSFEACPNSPAALALLREVLRAEGCPAEVELIAVETEEAAVQHRFFGSPTIRIDGHDIGAPPASGTPSLACRLYAQPDGRLAPHPPVAALTEAVRQACARSPNS